MQSIRITRAPLRLPSVLADCLPIHLSDALCQSGAPALEELRLHKGRVASVCAHGRTYRTGVSLSETEMNDILKRMCGGSLYAFSQSINQGYLSLSDGIRVGVCGSAALEKGSVIGVSQITGLIVRIPHAVNVSAKEILDCFLAQRAMRGILIYAPPGGGKTTVLRALAASLASPDYDFRTVAVDTREELKFTLDGGNLNLDILAGYPRKIGIEIAVRSLGAQIIVCDEIGDAADAQAILAAANCGVPLIASAHAASAEELLSRPAMHMLHRARVFGYYVGLLRGRDNGYSYRITPWEELDERLKRERREALLH